MPPPRCPYCDTRQPPERVGPHTWHCPCCARLFVVRDLTGALAGDGRHDVGGWAGPPKID